MRELKIDEEKLPAAMELIEAAGALMAEEDCDGDERAKNRLERLEKELRALCGRENLQIKDFKRYWSYTDLETIARKALMPQPVKEAVTNGEIREIVLHLLTLKEEEMDWWLGYLKVNTGLDNVTDYIFYPELVGLGPKAGLGEIADKIIADMR